MLYLVCYDTIDRVNEFICDDDKYFIVEADNDEKLATAIANIAIKYEWCSDATGVDNSCWNVRALGDNFKFKIFSPKVFRGTRL